MLLQGKSALVTGGARGIGLGFAKRWLKENPTLLWIADLTHGDETKELAATHPNVRLIQYDQGELASVTTMFEQMASEGPPIGAAALSAIFSEREPLLAANPLGIEKTIRVSLIGGIWVLQQVAMVMKSAGKGGRIVMVGSPHSHPHFCIPGCLAYNAAKAGCHAVMRTAATELFSDGITVNEVIPGWVDTPGERKFQDDAKIMAAVAKLPARRLIAPEEVAEVGTFFLHEVGGMICGQAYGITGMVDAPWWSNRSEGM